MKPQRKVNHNQLSFENGDVYISGELYGSETDFWNNVDNGKIEYTPPTANEIKKESGEYLLDAEYWSEPY